MVLGQGAYVDNFANGAPGPIWNGLIPATGLSIPAGDELILTQTSGSQNFDTSDYQSGGASASHPDPNQPMIHLTLDGTLYDYVDSAQVLNTGGYDLGATGRNESLQWRLIGTTGINNPGGDPPGTPEPGIISLLGSFGIGLAGVASRRKIASLRKH